ncbi:carbohydrate ABC transporter permease [Breznakiella homolactica]|uniref:Sugar ABC transporter permease n=1 Tax=Breznakiella homolactica TaxID=2798577 RepID=A0A7T7XQT5_9SPIR|nr:sugar ABC transporter permease [Breznakiella homolactica]QQO10732.1 sugar ABC transporter permease [Breznakiella homolactica]
MKSSTYRLQQNWMGYFFIFPALFVLVMMIMYPLLYGIYVSFFDTNLVNKWNFVGFRFYQRVITNLSFYQSLGRTFVFTFSTVLGRVVLGTGFAMILNNKRLPLRPVFRSIMVLPWFFPDVVIGMLWKWLYNSGYGLINHILMSLHIIKAPVEWLSNTSTVMAAVVVVCIWKGFPFMIVMILAALQTIPDELYEAAEMDGCGPLSRFVHVVLPGIMPVLSTATMLEIMWCFKHFTIIWNLTYGGPVDATNVVSIDIYKTGFEYLRFGESSTRAVLVFIIIMVLSIIQRKLVKEK